MAILTTRGRALRAPYPYHSTLNGRGLPLSYLDKSGTRMIGQVPPDQANVAPVEFGEQAQNPVFGAPYTVRDLTRGMGQRRQRKQPNGRYWYTLNARTRAGRAIVGPELTNYTPGTVDATNGINRFFEIAGKIFPLNGRYVLDGGTGGTGFTVAQDLGAAKVAADVIVAQANDGTSSRYAWIGMGDADAMWYFDGTTCTQTTGANVMYARAFALDAVNLYRFDDTNRMWQCDLYLDPRAAANWPSATDRIGSKDHGIVRATVDPLGALVICKADDIYTLNREGTVNRLFQQEQFISAVTNGAALATWRNDIYVTYGFASYRLSSGGDVASLTQVGPELMKDNGSDVRGYISAWQGTDFFALAGLYNPDTGYSYLMEYTGEIVEDETGRAEPVWHGSIVAGFAAKKITALHISERGAPSGHKMAYIGFSNGTISKYILACTPDPSDCDQERFSTSVGEVYNSRTYFNFPGERKAVLNASGEGDNLSSTNYARLSYRTSDGVSYTDLTDDFDAGERNKIQFPDSTSCVFMDTKLALYATAATATPQVSGLSIYYQLRTAPQEVLIVRVPAEDNQRMRDGTPYRLSASDIRDYLNILAGFAGGVAFVDPAGETHQVIVRQPQRAQGWLEGTMQPVDALEVQLVEQRPNETRGQWANLELLTWQQWEVFSWGQLEEV